MAIVKQKGLVAVNAAKVILKLAKLAKLAKTVTSGFFQPLQDLSKWINRWIEGKLYPTHKGIDTRVLFEYMMMEYFDNQDTEYWTLFREARVAILNNDDHVSRLDLAMFVRDYFKLKTPEIEAHYSMRSEPPVRISLEAIQEVILEVHAFCSPNVTPTVELSKYAHL